MSRQLKSSPPATIKVAASSGPEMPCQSLFIDGRRISAAFAGQQLPARSAVSLECDDTLFLTEVMGCEPQGDGFWRLELQVQQVLNGLQSLLALRTSLLGEEARFSGRYMREEICA